MSNIAKIKKIAKAINKLQSGKGCTVTIGGQTAYSKGGRINIPMGDFSDPEFMKMASGYIDHETGHEAHTEHVLFQQAGMTGGNLKASILNALEDARMEAVVAQNFPGAKINLTQLFAKCIHDGLIPSPDNVEPIEVVFSFILHRSREVACGYTGTYAPLAYQIMSEKAGQPFAEGLNKLVERVECCVDNQAVYELTEDILDYLQSESQEDPEDQSPESPESDDDSDQQSNSDNNSQQSEPCFEKRNKAKTICLI